MELDEQLKQNITKKYLKELGRSLSSISPVVNDIYMDLLSGDHSINITTRGKFTIAEVKYHRNGYTHHFLGVTAKNPNDKADWNYGVEVAVEKALFDLITKFYFDEAESRLDSEWTAILY